MYLGCDVPEGKRVCPFLSRRSSSSRLSRRSGLHSPPYVLIPAAHKPDEYAENRFEVMSQLLDVTGDLIAFLPMDKSVTCLMRLLRKLGGGHDGYFEGGDSLHQRRREVIIRRERGKCCLPPNDNLSPFCAKPNRCSTSLRTTSAGRLGRTTNKLRRRLNATSPRSNAATIARCSRCSLSSPQRATCRKSASAAAGASSSSTLPLGSTRLSRRSRNLMEVQVVDDSRFRCRVCGFRLDEPPWGDDGASPQYDICPCCGCESGYWDCTPEAARMNRQKWLAAGAKWFHPEKTPEGWNLEQQLACIPERYR